MIAEMKFILKFEGNTKVVRHRKNESITSQRSNTSFQSNESEIEHTGHSESHSKSLGKKWNGNYLYNTFVWSITQFLKPVFTTSFISTKETWVIVIARLNTTDINCTFFFLLRYASAATTIGQDFSRMLQHKTRCQ